LNTKSTEFDRLTDNAFDFLERAIGDLERAPKHSVINFYAAVELFLKARLLREHWSLVVDRDADRRRFDSGDFVSVSFDTACDRLRRIVGAPLPEPARESFYAIRRHRNRAVHFFTNATAGEELPKLAVEQLRAWYHLHELFRTQWKEEFETVSDKVRRVEAALLKYDKYLATAFDEVRGSIEHKEANGALFVHCARCRLKSAEVTRPFPGYTRHSCFVCRVGRQELLLACPDCEADNDFTGGLFECFACQTIFDEEGLAAHVSPEDSPLGDCVECETREVVVKYDDHYVCLSCLHIADELDVCRRCDRLTNGDMAESDEDGCVFCIDLF
jgi:hypothetical protein